MRRIVPHEIEDRAILGVVRSGQLLAHPPCELVGEPQIRAAVLRRLDGLAVPLHQPLGVGERAVLLGVRGRRQEEDLRGYLLGTRLARLDLRRVVPECRRLDLVGVAHDEPVEARERLALKRSVGGADGGVLSDHDESLRLPVDHAQHHRVVRVVAVDAREI